MNKYRIPDISEFVQGFEFEAKTEVTRVKIVNDKNTFITKTEWIKRKVDWMYPDNEIIKIKQDGDIVEITGKEYNKYSYFYDENIENLLKEKKIRVKI